MNICGVFLEVASIQQYVFGSNKLKENLGASYIVENIFKNNLKTALIKTFDRIPPNVENLDEWINSPEKVRILEPDIEVEVGYIGGGNALLFFKNDTLAVKLAREWSKILLTEAPGMVPSIAISRNIDPEYLINQNYKSVMNKLYRIMRENKYTNQPQTTLPRHGITAECSHTGLSAEFYEIEDKIPVFISCVAKSKINNSEKGTEEFKNKYKVELNGYDFPVELDKLGQNEGENHIAIVHIDGNGMGKKFSSCRSLIEVRTLSREIRKATEDSFGELINDLKLNIEIFKEKLKLNLSDETLPIRPIIIGGDDVTFVTHGKLGVYCAQIFMKAFASKNVSIGTSKKISSCAGIAITKTKYPFYRGYELAEDLCGQAKKKARIEEDKETSWLDFHIAYGGFSGSIEDIRKKNYSVAEGDLCLRPYRVDSDIEDYQNLSECLKGIEYLDKSISTRWPNSKLSELRDVLGLGKSSAQRFIQEMKYRGRNLPEVRKHIECSKSGWIDGIKKTPYFDMLELMDFYPIELIDSGGNK